MIIIPKYEETFTVRPEHLKLLENAYVGWEDCEYGAPCIDCKRPYGNSSVEGDMVEILGTKVKDGVYKLSLGDLGEFTIDYNDEEEFPEELSDVLRQLHLDTQTVLQIAIDTKQFKAGKYGKKDKYGGRWEFIESQ